MERVKNDERESAEKKASTEVRGKEHQDKGKNDKRCASNDGVQAVKGLPHHQVPQPSDFDTRALEQL